MKIPSGWSEKTIGNICPLQRGFDLPSQDLRKGQYPVVYSNGVLNYHEEFKVKGPGVVTGRSGTIGKVIYVEQNYWPHNTALWVTDFCDNDPKFIFYFLFNMHIERYANGTGIPTLNRNDLHSLKYFIPPLLEQKKISEVLSCWDESIKKIEKLITAKKTFKRGIMQKLLSGQVRFKGFNGKAEYSKLKGLVKEVSHRNRNSKAGTVLSVTNTSGFVIQTDHFDRSVASTDISNYKIVRQGQFGFNPSRVNVGSIAMLEEDIEGALSPMYVIFETVDGKLLPEYMKQFIKSSWFIGHVRCLTQGSVRDSLSFDALEQIRIFAPSIDEQRRIAETLSVIDKEIEFLERKRDLLKKQKKGLMQKLLTGKIRVKV